MSKPSELWKMAVDDRVRSLLESESSQNGKGNGKGKGKITRLTRRSCAAFSKTAPDHCLKIRLKARGLFVRNVLQAMELKAVVRVGTYSRVAAGIIQRGGAVRVRHLEGKKKSGRLNSRSRERSQKTTEKTCYRKPLAQNDITNRASYFHFVCQVWGGETQ